MGALKGKLKHLIAESKESAEACVFESCREISADLIRICRGMESTNQHKIFVLRFSAMLLDAVDFIENNLDWDQIFDFPIPTRNVPEQREYFREIFASGKVPHRGFVYFPWTEKPERFFYTGKGDAERIIRQHACLSNSLARASTLSLLYPRADSEKALFALEASVLCVLFNRGSISINNKAPTKVPPGRGAKVIQEISRSLKADLFDLQTKLSPSTLGG